MSATVEEARSLLKISAHVETYRSSGDRQIHLVVPVGAFRERMTAFAETHPAMVTICGARDMPDVPTEILVFTYSKLDVINRFDMLSGMAFPVVGQS